MSKVREVARLHPQTVTNHRQHIKRKPRIKAQINPCSQLQVDKRVWRAARKALEKGKPHGYTRIEAVSATEVYIR